jgi:hypothetical protein
MERPVIKRKYAPRLTEEKKQELIKLRDQGKSIIQITIKARVTHGQVLRLFYKNRA